MPNPIYQLFVYGSLRSGFRNPAYHYLTQYFHLLGEAIVKGKFYDNNGIPVAIPFEGTNFISGELYEINNPQEFDWIIAQLDDYEGLNVEVGEVALYRRETVTTYKNGQQNNSWIYWYNGSVQHLPEIETGDVLKYLQEKNKP